MFRFRKAALLVGSAMFLPAVIFCYLSISLIHLNLEEIRSLPNTYLWVLRSFFLLWALCIVPMLLALRGKSQWPARSLVALGAAIFVFDLGRGFWLSSWLQVVVFGLVEIVIIGLILTVTWRVELRRLLEYAALFSVVVIIATGAVHINTVGPHLVWNVLKEIARPTAQEVPVHPNPWRSVDDKARTFRRSVDIQAIAPQRSDVDVLTGNSIRVSSTSPPGATVASLPVLLSPPPQRAMVDVSVELVEGDIAVGIKNPVTDQWFYLQDVKQQDGNHQTLHIPLYPGADSVEVLFANGRIGQDRFLFEIEGADVFELAASSPEQVSRTGNVYQIILDAFQFSKFLKITQEQPQLLPDGFTVYEQFRTSQPSTAWSLPTIVSGTYYDSASGVAGDTWREQTYHSGLVADLRAADIPSYQYTWFSRHCADRSTYCLSSQDYRFEVLSHIADNFILDLTFLRTLPNSLRAVLIGSVGQPERPANSWDYGFSLTSKLGGGRTRTSDDHILKDFYFSLNLFTIDFFKRMLVQDVARPDDGQFIFFHAMVPHAPYARNESCEFIPPDERTSENLTDRSRGQNVCALRLVGWLVEQLKLQNRFDDALIIVHSDHGAIQVPPGENVKPDQLKPEDWPSWAVDSSGSGLLMVKQPRAVSTSQSRAPAQTIDIAPTILHHFGVAPPDHYLGTPLQELSEDSQRQMTFFAMGRPVIGSSVKYLSKYVKDKDGEWRFEANVSTDP